LALNSDTICVELIMGCFILNLNECMSSMFINSVGDILMNKLLLFWMVMIIGFGAGFARADSNSNTDESSWRSSDLGVSSFGEQWSGPAMPKEQLEGKVVWVTILKSSSSDVKTLKDMAQLDRLYRRKGAVIIAIHYIMTTKSKALDNVSRADARFPVYENARVTYKGRDRKGVTNTRNAYRLPYAILYGADGMIAWEGPCMPAQSQMAAILQRELKKMPKKASLQDDNTDDESSSIDELFDDLDTSRIADIESLVKKHRMGQAIAKCETSKDADNDRTSQAKELLGRLKAYASQQMAAAKEQRKILPSKMVSMLTEIRRDFSGTEYAEEASELLDKCRKDKEFQSDLDAERSYQSVLKYSESIPVPEQGENYGEWQKKNRRRLDALKRKVDAFKDKNSQSMFCKKLDDLLKDYEEKKVSDVETNNAKVKPVVEKVDNVEDSVKDTTTSAAEELLKEMKLDSEDSGNKTKE